MTFNIRIKDEVLMFPIWEDDYQTSRSGASSAQNINNAMKVLHGYVFIFITVRQKFKKVTASDIWVLYEVLGPRQDF